MIELENDVRTFVEEKGLRDLYSDLTECFDKFSKENENFPYKLCKPGSIYVANGSRFLVRIWGDEFYIPDYFKSGKPLRQVHYFNYYEPPDAIIDIAVSQFDVHFEDIKIPEVLLLARDHWFVKKHYSLNRKNLLPSDTF